METIYFWKPAQADGYLSNWYSAPFEADGIYFSCSEQYYMYMKACHFEDWDTARRILVESSPAQMKEWGRKTRGFDATEWDRVKMTYMYQACMYKFRANPKLAQRLIATGTARLAESSPFDIVWGIGISASQARDGIPWRGDSLLGQI